MATKLSKKEAKERLLKGNARFVEGRTELKNFLARRKELLEGQKPFATVITCSDSRVDPEYIFDTDLGEIFVIRTAGNVLDEIALGSVEYGVGHLKTPLLVVLAHTSCGAVTATYNAVKNGEKEEGALGKIIEKIRPVVESVLGKKGSSEDEINEAIDLNAKAVVEDILSRSKVVKEAKDSGDLEIITWKYHLDSGKVSDI